MFGVGLPELAVIMVVGILIFGPDRLPEYARQAGRMLRQLRTFAQSAQNDLRGELGPEFSELKLADLDPRVAIRKHILDVMDADDLAEAQAARNAPKPGGPDLGPDERPPFDAEAT